MSGGPVTFQLDTKVPLARFVPVNSPNGVAPVAALDFVLGSQTITCSVVALADAFAGRCAQRTNTVAGAPAGQQLTMAASCEAAVAWRWDEVADGGVAPPPKVLPGKGGAP